MYPTLGLGVIVTWYLAISSFLGIICLAVGTLLGHRLLSRRRFKKHVVIVDKATSQLKETGVFLRTVADLNKEDILRLQIRLHHVGAYDGPLDGTLNTGIIEAIVNTAEERGIDLEAEALDMFEKPRYRNVMPISLQQEITVQTAHERLRAAEARRHLHPAS